MNKVENSRLILADCMNEAINVVASAIRAKGAFPWRSLTIDRIDNLLHGSDFEVPIFDRLNRNEGAKLT